MPKTQHNEDCHFDGHDWWCRPSCPTRKALEPRKRIVEGSRVEVESSVIKSLGYDKSSASMEVEFVTTGKVFIYYAVPEEVYQKLLTAKSVGIEFHKSIRGKYKHVEREQDDDD